MQGMFEETNYLSSPYEIFIFDNSVDGYPVKSHWHYFCEILYVTEGQAFVTCNENVYPIETGDFVFFHPQAIHSIYGDSHVRYFVCKFDLSLLKMSGSHIPGFQKVILAAANNKSAPIVIKDTLLGDFDLVKMFESCQKEIQEMQYGYDIYIQAQLSALLTRMLRVWHNNGFQPENTEPVATTYRPLWLVAEYIDKNLSQPLKVEDLAEWCNMSYSYFAKQFHTIYGRSCKEYIAFMRIARAKDLLLFTGYDLNYIAQETGFADCSHLIRTFRKLEHTTPKQFRLSNGISR